MVISSEEENDQRVGTSEERDSLQPGGQWPVVDGSSQCSQAVAIVLGCCVPCLLCCGRRVASFFLGELLPRCSNVALREPHLHIRCTRAPFLGTDWAARSAVGARRCRPELPPFPVSPVPSLPNFQPPQSKLVEATERNRNRKKEKKKQGKWHRGQRLSHVVLTCPLGENGPP